MLSRPLSVGKAQEGESVGKRNFYFIEHLLCVMLDF